MTRDQVEWLGREQTRTVSSLRVGMEFVLPGQFSRLVINRSGIQITAPLVVMGNLSEFMVFGLFVCLFVCFLLSNL